MPVKEIEQKLFELPPLPYDVNSLEPYFDSQTMEVHHNEHHRAYVNNLNKAISTLDLDPDHDSLDKILQNVSNYSDDVRNYGGGHYNHSFFWESLSGETENKEPLAELSEAIQDFFDSFENFRDEFTTAALNLFGSGWVWLVLDERTLKIGTTANQDNPLMDVSEFKGDPLLGLDMWEHAYYLKYKNNKKEYIQAFWKVINWKEIYRRYMLAHPDKW